MKQHRTKRGRYSSTYSKVAVSLVFLGCAVGIGASVFSTDTIHVQADIIQAPDTLAPILARIGDCESGINGKPGTRRQYLPNGSLVMHINANGLWQDVGMFQINQSPEHMQLEAKLGINVLTTEGNTAMAKYIYAHEGTGPWVSSFKCWRQ